MLEKSFVLFKPDSYREHRIIEEVRGYLNYNKLKIIKEMSLKLTSDNIQNIWEFTKQDVISRKILNKYIRDRKLLLIVLEGEDAIKKINILKKIIRRKYAVNFLQNCIHAPRTQEEYEKDIDIFSGGVKNYKIKNRLIYDTGEFEKFEKLLKNNEKMNENIDKIYSIIINKNIDTYLDINNHICKYKLYLHNDSIHELIYIVGALYNFLPKISLVEAYLMAISAEQNSKCLIMSAHQKTTVGAVYCKLREVGVIVSIE